MEYAGSYGKRGYVKRGLSWKTQVWKTQVWKTRVVMENAGIRDFSLINKSMIINMITLFL